MWVLSFIISISACTYFIIDSTIYFLKYDVVTKIDVIYEQPTPFPTVTICNRENYNLTLEKILFCQLNYNRDCQENPERYFEKYFDSRYKECFRFNSGTNLSGVLNATYGGKENGLWLDFNIEALEDYSSLIVYIHNNTISPLSLYNKGIEISPGSTHYFEVNRVFMQKLEKPYSHCLRHMIQFDGNQTLIDFILKSGRIYTQKECFELCFNLHYTEVNPCDCTNGTDYNNVFDKCFSTLDWYSSLWNCTLKFRKDFAENLFHEKCMNYCPIECDYVSYTVTKFNLDYPKSGNISDKDKINFFDSKYDTYEEVQKSYFSFVVYYEELKYTLISESPSMEIFDLVSITGGLLGLFVGLSFLSFVEVFEFFIRMIFILAE